MIGDIPYIVFEESQIRNERTIKKLIIALIVSLCLLFITNIAWIVYESQFEDISYTQDGGGINNINTGSQGDLTYGSNN